jgi:hypothetical protein
MTTLEFPPENTEVNFEFFKKAIYSEKGVQGLFIRHCFGFTFTKATITFYTHDDSAKRYKINEETYKQLVAYRDESNTCDINKGE